MTCSLLVRVCIALPKILTKAQVRRQELKSCTIKLQFCSGLPHFRVHVDHMFPTGTTPVRGNLAVPQACTANSCTAE